MWGAPRPHRWSCASCDLTSSFSTLPASHCSGPVQHPVSFRGGLALYYEIGFVPNGFAHLWANASLLITFKVHVGSVLTSVGKTYQMHFLFTVFSTYNVLLRMEASTKVASVQVLSANSDRIFKDIFKKRERRVITLNETLMLTSDTRPNTAPNDAQN